MSENTDTDQLHSHVKTFSEVQEIVSEFYDTLPGPVVGSFSKEKKTPEQCEAFKKKIDEAQAIFDEIKATRLASKEDVFDEETLAGMNKAKLQKIAITFGMNPKQTAPKLREALVGQSKSIPVLQTRYWRLEDELGMKKGSALIARLREAREAYHTASGEEYLHPLQMEARPPEMPEQ